MACHLAGAKPLSNQYWNIVNSNLRNKLPWNLERNSFIFIQENAFENVVWKMAAILSWPQWVKSVLHMETCFHVTSIQNWHSKSILNSNQFSQESMCQYICRKFWLSVLLFTNTQIVSEDVITSDNYCCLDPIMFAWRMCNYSEVIILNDI